MFKHSRVRIETIYRDKLPSIRKVRLNQSKLRNLKFKNCAW